MASYAIISQEPFADKTRYKVILKADDDYQETQEYVGDETTLEEAAAHFNAERMAASNKKIQTENSPVFVEVTATIDIPTVDEAVK